jgi:MoxR-like ATPase
MSMIRQDVEDISGSLDKLRLEIGKCLIGQKEVLEQVLVCMVAGGHALIEGVPGLGKTLLVRALTQAVGGNFSRLQFTPDLMPSDVTGHSMYDMNQQKWVIRKGPIFCNFLLADEINRAPAKTQSALLEVMQEQQVTIEGESLPLKMPFLVLATQNPIEQEGTYPLPEAQLDRFLLNIVIDYPDTNEELEIVEQITSKAIGDKLDISNVDTILSPADIIRAQAVAVSLTLDRKIADYAVRIASATREWSGIDIGAGPRGSLALVRAGRALALLSGRDFVTPDDVKKVAPSVLMHRIRLTPDYEIEGYGASRVIAELIEDIEAPRV